MASYIARRLVAMVLMLIALSMIVFLLFNALPADPARLTCGKACTPAVIEANRVRLGLDKPLYEQYGVFVKGIFAGRTYGSGTATFECSAPCLGYSFRKGEEVTVLISQALPVTIQLALGAFVLWIVVGVSVGIVAALRRGKWQDRTIMGFALIGYSFPSFFIGLLLIFFVQIQLGSGRLRGLRPVLRQPIAVVPGADPALDRSGAALRGVLRPAHPQPDARDARRGLHPHRPVEGPQRAHRHRQARAPCRPHADRHRSGSRPRRPARRRHRHRSGLQPSRASAGCRSTR